jgi:hypothetical protein
MWDLAPMNIYINYSLHVNYSSLPNMGPGYYIITIKNLLKLQLLMTNFVYNLLHYPKAMDSDGAPT